MQTKEGKEPFIDHLHNTTWRHGSLRRDSERKILTNRNAVGKAMLDLNRTDLLITGLTRSFYTSYHDLLDPVDTYREKQKTCFAVNLLFTKKHLYFVSDSAIHSKPDPETLANIAESSSEFVADLGIKPRVALLSYSSFGSSPGKESKRIRDAVRVLENRDPEFEFDGEMTANVALNYSAISELFPNCRLSGPANVLIMPDLDSAHISSRMMREIGATDLIGPILINQSKSFQILRMGMSVNEIVNTVLFALYEHVR